VPPGVFFADLPQEKQLALTEVIGPLYRQLVLEAPDALEQSAGLSLVHAAWLEVVGQCELGRVLVGANDFGQDGEAQGALGRHMRTVKMKDQLVKTFLQVRNFKKKWALIDEQPLLEGLRDLDPDE